MIKIPDICKTCEHLKSRVCAVGKLHEISWGKTNFTCADWSPLDSAKSRCGDCKHAALNVRYCTKHGEDIDPGHSCEWYEHG